METRKEKHPTDDSVNFLATSDQLASVDAEDDGQLSIFAASFDTAVSPKLTLDGLWLPLFALQKGDDQDYSSDFLDSKGNGLRLNIISPKDTTRANLFDKELLVWLTGAIRKALDEGRRPTRRIQFRASSFLIDAGRGVSGAAYKRLKDTLNRLKNTRFEQLEIVNDKPTGTKRDIGFLSAYEYRSIGNNGSLVEVILSDHFFASILNNKGVLAMDKQYFTFRKSYTRRLYEIARKAVGHQQRIIEFRESTLMQRMGARCSPTDFRRLVKEAIDEGIPGYVINIAGQGKSARRYQFLRESTPDDSLDSAPVASQTTIE